MKCFLWRNIVQLLNFENGNFIFNMMYSHPHSKVLHRTLDLLIFVENCGQNDGEEEVSSQGAV